MEVATFGELLATATAWREGKGGERVEGRRFGRPPAVGLVAYEHDDDRGVRVRAKLAQPLRHVLKAAALAHVVHDEGAQRAAVVPVEARARGLEKVGQGQDKVREKVGKG
eukprot:6212911-Pleurochrysis_carterae.AAC.4